MEGIVRDIVFMMIGMGAGMAACPFMMKGIKKWRTNRKVDRMLKEMGQLNKEETQNAKDQNSTIEDN